MKAPGGAYVWVSDSGLEFKRKIFQAAQVPEKIRVSTCQKHGTGGQFSGDDSGSSGS